MRGRRYSTGGGSHNARAPVPSGGWKRPAWLGACALFGLAYPFVALLNPPWTYMLLGLPLLAVGWLTRPLNPTVRLLGFVVFGLAAVLAWGMVSAL